MIRLVHFRRLWETIGGSYEVSREPSFSDPISQICTQRQVEDSRYLDWCALIGEAPRYHRRQWEYCFTLQALDRAGCLVASTRGLAVYRPDDPLLSVMTSLGVLADIDELRRDISRYSSSASDFLGQADQPFLSPQDHPASLIGSARPDGAADSVATGTYDFCWSIAELQRLGSVENVILYVQAAMNRLRAGGVGVFTTDLHWGAGLNSLSDGQSVLLRRSDLRRLAEQMRDCGHEVALNFHDGSGKFDRYIDTAPYKSDPHLKLQVGSFVVTSFGLIVTKATSASRLGMNGRSDVVRLNSQRADLEAGSGRGPSIDASPRVSETDTSQAIIDELGQFGARLEALEAVLLASGSNPLADPADVAISSIELRQEGQEFMRADYFDIWRLLQNPREQGEAEIRALCRNVFLGDYTALCRVLGRYKMYVDTRDIGIAAHLLLDGFWEMWVTEAMMRHVRQGMTVLDVGANLGYFSLLLADLTGPTGRVLSFEPNPHMSSLARRSLEINGFAPWSSLHEVALGDQEGEIQFSARLDHPGGAHVVTGGEGNLSVPVRRLDSMSEALNADFIKMDVEGYEHHVWKGMTGILARQRPLTIFMEFNISRFENPRGFLDDIFSHGFSSAIVDYRQGVIPVSMENLFSQSHSADHMLVFQRS